MEEGLPSSLGTCLKKWRQIKGLGLSELARRSGYPIFPATIKNLETGYITNTNDSNVVRLAKSLGIRPKLLFARADPDNLSFGDKLDDLFEKYADVPEEAREQLSESCLKTCDDMCRRRLERSAEQAELDLDSAELAATGPVLTPSR